MSQAPLGWLGILRLGMVQTALGAIVVLTTSTLNRVMVVELALPAMLPGVLVAAHYAVQMIRPKFGHGSDIGGRRTPWIVGGMGLLAFSGSLAACATAWMSVNVTAGILLAVIAFVLIGAGVGASGTSLLALLAARVAPERRAAAATIVWLMMIFGMAVTAGIVGNLLDPFSASWLLVVSSSVALIAFLVTCLAVWGVEGRAPAFVKDKPGAVQSDFREALKEVWADSKARRFTIFVFVSMLAYSGQDLVLEPFAGHIFGMTPGESTKLAGVQHGGVFAGMLLVAITSTTLRVFRKVPLLFWAVGGCGVSALALFGLVIAGNFSTWWPLQANVFLLGLANGAFAVAAIAGMMALAGAAGPRKEGIRMGVWGASQAIAFGLGGFLGTVAVDVVRYLTGSPLHAYAAVFLAEALLFVWAARLAAVNLSETPGRDFARGKIGQIPDTSSAEVPA
ncbi:MAG: BCD family MFS transporter [Pseudomonadota bacterium]